MIPLEPSATLVGRKVINPARPEWGVGEVLRVSEATENGVTAHRVSVHFPTGHRTLVVPPAKLCDPQPEQKRQSGWLDGLSKTDLDTKLRALPEDVQFFLGLPHQRIAAAAIMYDWDESDAGLVRWARKQTMTSDPLSLWTRDELQSAFADFRARRDQWLRDAVGNWRKEHPRAGLENVLEKVEPATRRRMIAAAR